MSLTIENDEIINDRYRIIGVLGRGGYGVVYKVYDFQRKAEVAMKIDMKPVGSVLIEWKVLQDLKGGEGIPEIYDKGKINQLNYMTTQLLGSNLSDLRKKLNYFSLATTTLILLQAMNRIEFIHEMGYLHRDIKPHQFLIGPDNKIYLVDFGIAKKYETEGHHIAFQTECLRAGSSSYASINSHIGIRLSRRDDLESLVYSAIYLIRGSLPWQSSSKMNDNKRWQIAFNLKRTIKDEDLFKGCPKQLQTILSYVRNLKFEEKPNYSYIVNLIHVIRKNNSLDSTHFDWLIKTSKKLNETKKTEEKVSIKRSKSKKKPMKKKLQMSTMRPSSSNDIMMTHNTMHVLLNSKKKKNIVFLTDQTELNKNHTNSGEETLRNVIPEFVDRRKIFEELSDFRTRYFKFNNVC